MKTLWFVFTVITISDGILILPDSATQGPNPQDIATPEPEYVDIDLPLNQPNLHGVMTPFNKFSLPTFTNVAAQVSHIPEIPLKVKGYQYRNPGKRFIYRTF